MNKMERMLWGAKKLVWGRGAAIAAAASLWTGALGGCASSGQVADLEGKVKEAQDSARQSQTIATDAANHAKRLEQAIGRLMAASADGGGAQRDQDLDGRVAALAKRLDAVAADVTATKNSASLTPDGIAKLQSIVNGAAAKVEQQRQEVANLTSAVAELQGGGGSAKPDPAVESAVIELAQSRRATAELMAKVRSLLQYQRDSLQRQKEALDTLLGELRQTAGTLPNSGNDPGAKLRVSLNNQVKAFEAQSNALGETIQQYGDTIESFDVLFADLERGSAGRR
jgi:chromosome segregation ATPase